ncbi:hypothetical protein JYU34_013293 [Plutella xylostella]|uniref:Uncharacterized protein n=1 Tax=Plutella xylostella TaxID=51655 RepID=A0ABQ7Q9I1_PLUXY|nr:hypothetical protein JYU34_013293 [Plutella xylostella]
MAANTMIYYIVLLAINTLPAQALKCYRCGSTYLKEHVIPMDTYCHDMFSSDWTQGLPLGWSFFPSGQYYDIRDGVLHYYQSNMTMCEGYYPNNQRPFCYKRFLDVGDNFIQRGCHQEMTVKTREDYKNIDKTSISWKLRRIQKVLVDRMERTGEKSACLSSTSQILTKFNMEVTMPVYYHVCLCTSDFCNGCERVVMYWVCFVVVVFKVVADYTCF